MTANATGLTPADWVYAPGDPWAVASPTCPLGAEGCPTCRDAQPCLGDLLAYSGRIEHTRRRIADEIAGARQRLAWVAHQRQAIRDLSPQIVHSLHATGVLNADCIPGQAEHDLIARRQDQLAALDALIELTEAAIDACYEPKTSSTST
jgi:hypothetical protein